MILDFSKRKVKHGSDSGYTAGCRCVECTEAHRIKHLTYYDSEKSVRYGQKYYNANKDKVCEQSRKYRLETRLAIIMPILKFQRYRCAVCKDNIDITAHLDHWHDCTMCNNKRIGCKQCFRGLLCRPCNTYLLGSTEKRKRLDLLGEAFHNYLNNPTYKQMEREL